MHRGGRPQPREPKRFDATNSATEASSRTTIVATRPKLGILVSYDEDAHAERRHD